MWEKKIRIYDTPGVHNNFSWDLTRLHYTELPGFESLVTYILSKWGLSQGAIMDYYGYLQVGKSCLLSFLTMWPFGFNVFTSTFCVFKFPSFFFSFFLSEVGFTWDTDLSVGLMHCAQNPLALWTSTHWSELALLVGPCTIHETYKPHFSTTFSLKMGLTALFIHLKIILL